MTDPIGTAQDRELIEALQKRTEWRDEFSAGTRDLLEEAADALQSRIAEVGRLTAALERIAKGYGHCGACGTPCGLVTDTCSCERPYWEPDDPRETASAALSLQRRV